MPKRARAIRMRFCATKFAWSARPSLSAWASTSPMCASSSTPIFPRMSRATTRRLAARAATVCPASACCSTRAAMSPSTSDSSARSRTRMRGGRRAPSSTAWRRSPTAPNADALSCCAISAKTGPTRRVVSAAMAATTASNHARVTTPRLRARSSSAACCASPKCRASASGFSMLPMCWRAPTPRRSDAGRTTSCRPTASARTARARRGFRSGASLCSQDTWR